MRTRLTDLAVRKLPLSENGQVTYWDELTPNFGVRCSTRSKSYIVLLGEKRRRKTLGRYPDLSLADARKQAKQLLAANALEGDALFLSQFAPVSFTEAKARFLEDSRRRNKPRTFKDYKRLLDRHFNFSGDLQTVERKQIMKVISELSATPSEQSHAFVAIRTMMNWCVRHGLIAHSVVPPLKQKAAERNRVLTDDELGQVYRRSSDSSQILATCCSQRQPILRNHSQHMHGIRPVLTRDWMMWGRTRCTTLGVCLQQSTLRLVPQFM